MATLLDDCFRPGSKRLLHAEALSILKSRTRTTAPTERVAIAQVCGRVAAAALHAPRPIPAHTNAAVDGYAFAYRDYAQERGAELLLAGRAAAGHPAEHRLQPGQCVRIFTGAVMPEGCDTVVMQEDVRLSGAQVHVPPGLKPGANRRLAGEDVPAGHELFAPGTRLRPQDVAALAAAGFAEVECHQRLEVAVISTGDEVVAPGGALRPGQVYDANAPMLTGLIEAGGARVHPCGIWPDDPGLIRSRLTELAGSHSVIISSGGASMGEEDHMVRALASLGTCHLWQLAIKPGRPMAFGQIATGSGAAARTCVFVGLPGNPVAVFVCFLMYVRPLLAALGGQRWPEPRRYQLPAAFAFKGRKPGRREFWRGLLREGPDGQLLVDKFARDGSGLISGLRAADGLIEIAEERGDIRVGEPVDFIPFSEFGIIGG